MRLNPYAWLAILAVVLAIGTGIWFNGRTHGVSSMQAKVEAKDKALGEAAAALRHAGQQMREITAQTEANAQAAADATKEAETAAREAVKEQAETAKRVTSLQRQLDKERTGCIDGQRPICGVPLR